MDQESKNQQKQPEVNQNRKTEQSTKDRGAEEQSQQMRDQMQKIPKKSSIDYFQGQQAGSMQANVNTNYHYSQPHYPHHSYPQHYYHSAKVQMPEPPAYGMVHSGYHYMHPPSYNLMPYEKGWNFEEGRFERRRGCYGRGRGSGCWKQRDENKRKHHKKNKNWKEGDESKKSRNRNRSSSSSSSNSQQSDELKVEKQMKKFQSLEQKKAKMTKFEQFKNALSHTFTSYNVPEYQQEKMINYLLRRYDNAEDLTPLIQMIAILEKQSPHYFTTPFLSLVSISKQIIKNGFQLKQINGKIDKKLFYKNRKSNKDMEFSSKHPNAIPIQFLEVPHLLQLDLNRTLFLVDGNNVMEKQKIFRLYQESPHVEERVEGQVRLQWLLAETLKAELFFDDKYGSDLYSNVKQSLLKEEEIEMLQSVPVHFADRDTNTAATADMKIVERLTQIVINQQYANHEIVLISADRDLAQLCRQIYPIKQSSGIYLFKFCKQVIRNKYYNRPEMKGIIKCIFSY